MTRHTRHSAERGNSATAEVESTPAVSSRRSHRKSRNGCAECKRRHIRCDERYPTCINCEIAERTCVFPAPKPSKRRLKQAHQLQSPTTNAPLPRSPSPSDAITVRHNNAPPTPHTQSTAVAECLPGLGNLSATLLETTFTAQHMILLRHADAVPNFTGPNYSVVDIAIHYAVDSPYLLDEALAFAAFHLSHTFPGSANELSYLATELQNRALASFTRLTESTPKDDKATGVPRFLFPAILGRHVLAHALVHHATEFHALIDRLVECFNLNRGILSVTPPARDFLNDSEIRPFLSPMLAAYNSISSPGNECDPLSRLLDDADLSETSTAACRQAIETLQRAFDTCRSLKEEDYPQSASTFSVKIESDFVDMLRKRRPEALVVLAYYGVLLHRCHCFWAFRDGGASMIRAISGHLGSYWQDVLAWPMRVLEED